jgi:predicted HTH domain antitoxin
MTVNITELRMRELTLAIPDEAVAALAESPEEAGAELRMLAAVKLFELKKLSSGAAARLAGVSRVDFLSRIRAYGIATFQQTEEELLDERQALMIAFDDGRRHVLPAPPFEVPPNVDPFEIVGVDQIVIAWIRALAKRRADLRYKIRHVREGFRASGDFFVPQTC